MAKEWKTTKEQQKDGLKRQCVIEYADRKVEFNITFMYLQIVVYLLFVSGGRGKTNRKTNFFIAVPSCMLEKEKRKVITF